MGIIIDSDVMGSTISTVVDCMFIFGIIMFVGSFIAIPIVLICRYRKRQGCFGDTATIHYPTLQSQQPATTYQVTTVATPGYQQPPFPQGQGYPHDNQANSLPPGYEGYNPAVIHPNVSYSTGFTPANNQKS